MAKRIQHDEEKLDKVEIGAAFIAAFARWEYNHTPIELVWEVFPEAGKSYCEDKAGYIKEFGPLAWVGTLDKGRILKLASAVNAWSKLDV